MGTSTKKTTDKENKSDTTTKNETTSSGGKDVNDGGKPAREFKHGKGETTGSKGSQA